jgi:hypothetical protein
LGTPPDRSRAATAVQIAPSLVVGLSCAAFAAFLACGALLLSFSPQSPLCGPGCLEMRLQALAGEGGRLDADGEAQARRLIGSELGLSPLDTGSWLRLAALEAGRGPLNAKAKAALLASYRFTPVDAEMARWRLTFLFEHWQELDPQLRAAAETEIQDLMVAPSSIDILRQMQATIANPTGRLACALLIDRFSTH